MSCQNAPNSYMHMSWQLLYSKGRWTRENTEWHRQASTDHKQKVNMQPTRSLSLQTDTWKRVQSWDMTLPPEIFRFHNSNNNKKVKEIVAVGPNLKWENMQNQQYNKSHNFWFKTLSIVMGHLKDVGFQRTLWLMAIFSPPWLVRNCSGYTSRSLGWRSSSSVTDRKKVHVLPPLVTFTSTF